MCGGWDDGRCSGLLRKVNRVGDERDPNEECCGVEYSKEGFTKYRANRAHYGFLSCYDVRLSWSAAVFGVSPDGRCVCVSRAVLVGVEFVQPSIAYSKEVGDLVENGAPNLCL